MTPLDSSNACNVFEAPPTYTLKFTASTATPDAADYTPWYKTDDVGAVNGVVVVRIARLLVGFVADEYLVVVALAVLYPDVKRPVVIVAKELLVTVIDSAKLVLLVNEVTVVDKLKLDDMKFEVDVEASSVVDNTMLKLVADAVLVDDSDDTVVL